MTGFPWTVLAIGQTTDTTAIRRAYAERLKAMDLDRQIAEYDMLRRARDEALRLAANPAGQEDGFGLGSLDDEEIAATVTDDNDADDGFEWEICAADLMAEEVTSPADVSARAEGPPRDAIPDGWTELAAILFPDGLPSEEALTFGEAEDAEAALARLIASAETRDLEHHAAIDHNLAEMLAGAWPRSAPVVDMASNAFHWLEEAGGLDERPALRFLNARTKGMRFHDAVLVKEHPLHKAWIELSTPGKVTWFRKMKTKHEDITDLLAIIRSRFPELESLLDAERIQSWETPSSDMVSRGVQWLFIAFLVIQALRFCAFGGEGIDPEGVEDGAETARLEAMDTASKTAFGATYSWVRTADEDVASAFEASLGPVSGATLYGDPRAFVRQRLLAARQRLAFVDLVQVQTVHLGWLKSAWEKGEGVCKAVLDGSFSAGDPGVTQDSLEKEQALARRLLEGGFLRGSAPTGEQSFSIPPWLGEAALRDSGLPADTFAAALQDPAHASRCAVEIALLDNALKAPSRVPIETLRGL